jgi:uncharacterized protein YpmS
MTQTLYHIYVKDRCICHSMNENDFNAAWEVLNNLVEIYTEYQKEDLSFEKIVNNKQVSLESSH